ALPDLLAEPPTERYVFSEYHALHFPNAVLMVCDGRYKYIHYHNDPPELYDLETDPGENNSLHGKEEYANIETRMREALLALVDPDELDHKAKAAQAALIESHGGYEAVQKRGHFHNSPIPGEKAEFKKG
ncbi:MAG: DUF4976 domain-containing protein, partial [Verrucomicrobia bacterium]|nr:DUF4976 domain-containing protein [Verrucomicrobiota bacterium]